MVFSANNSLLRSLETALPATHSLHTYGRFCLRDSSRLRSGNKPAGPQRPGSAALTRSRGGSLRHCFRLRSCWLLILSPYPYMVGKPCLLQKVGNKGHSIQAFPPFFNSPYAIGGGTVPFAGNSLFIRPFAVREGAEYFTHLLTIGDTASGPLGSFFSLIFIAAAKPCRSAVPLAPPAARSRLFSAGPNKTDAL